MKNFFKVTAVLISILYSHLLLAQAPLSALVTSSLLSTNVCQGGVIKFIATPFGGTGAPYQFSWNGGVPTGVSSFSGAPTNVIGAQSVTLIVYDNTNTPSSPISIPYNVLVATGGFPFITLSSSIVCPYDTLRVSPGPSSTIGQSVNCSNTSPVGQCDIVPIPGQLPATFTVPLQDNQSGCWTEHSFSVNPPATQNCFLAPALSSAPVTLSSQSQVPPTGTHFAINHDVIIAPGASISFSNHQIYMAPGVKIIVRTGASLNIQGCWLHACNCMWYGIEVQGSGSLQVSQASIIEDAIYAISTDLKPTSNPTIKVNKTLFNKNNVGILIQRKTGNLTANIDLNDNIFTCRNFKQPNQFYLLNLQNSTTQFNQLLNFFHNQWSNLGQSGFAVYPKTTTVYKHRSNAGMMFDTYTGQQLNIGQAPSVISGMYPVSNIFDYLNYGILARVSNIYVHKNQFQNLPGNAVYNPLKPNSTGPLMNLKAMGVGIYAVNEDMRSSINIGQNSAKTTIATNLFYNNLRAIDISNYLNVDVGFNIIMNTTTSPLSSFVNPGNWNAQYGIQLSNLRAGPIGLPDQVIHDNFIDRTAYGIHVLRSYYDAKKILILCNELGRVNNFNVPGLYMYQGIVLEDAGGNSSANIPTNGYAVSSNTIRHAMQNAIFASQIKKGLFIVFNGTKTWHWPGTCNGDVSVDPGTGSGKKESACIQASFCDNGSIYCNQFLNSCHPGGPPSNRINQAHGILIDNSTRMTVTGNEVGRASCPGAVALNWAVTFRGACMPALFTNNKMMNSHIAYNLDGTIGTQGSSTSPLNFDWQLGNGINRQTNVTASALALASILNLRNNSIPIANIGVNVGCGVGSPYDLSNCGSLVNAAVGGSLFPGCGILMGNGTGATSAGGGTSPDGQPISIEVGCVSNVPNLAQTDTARTLSGGRMQEILEDSSTQAMLGSERVWNNQRFLWEHIYSKNLYSQATPAVQAFYNQNQNTGLGRLALTDAALFQHDVTTAALKNNFLASNNLEIKRQTVNNSKIKLADTSLLQPALDSSDIASLMNIANGCPETDGAAFYEARSILNILFGQQLDYSSSCLTGNVYRDSESIVLSGNSYGRIFPNPNNGTFYVDAGEDQNLEIEIYNVLGELITKPYNVSGKQVQVEGLSSGVYLVKVIMNGIPNKLQRIVVTR